jgi:hypothetical protein
LDEQQRLQQQRLQHQQCSTATVGWRKALAHLTQTAKVHATSQATQACLTQANVDSMPLHLSMHLAANYKH